LFDFPFFIFFKTTRKGGTIRARKKGGTIVGKDQHLADGGRDTAGTVWRVV
jgi:hypothetical protein